MNDAVFHFAQPWWLLALLLIPLVLGWLWYSRPTRHKGREHQYADAHLLPLLIGNNKANTSRSRQPLIVWTLTWTLLILAMAGPRWGYQQIRGFQPAADMVILLDISASMNIQDVRPSRLARARQEIQDLVRLNPGIRLGLIAFASIAHVATPITEDGDSLIRQLPGLSTDLVRLHGSNLGNALKLAASLLEAQGKESSHHILLLSDGDFGDPELQQKIRELKKQDIRLHVLALGTDGGGPVPYLTATGGKAVVSRLNEQAMRALAEAGDGVYQLADYRDNDSEQIVKAVMSQAGLKQDQSTPTRIWNEQFYWALIPAMIILLLLTGRKPGEQQ
jgi:Ca-activated chloride channel family protein